MDSPMGAATPHYAPTQQNTLLACFTPTMGLLAMGLLVLVLPMVLLTAESFVLPFIEASPLLNFGQDMSGQTQLPWHFYIKATVFFVLAIWLIGYLATQLKMAYFKPWAARFSRPDPLHVDYAPHPTASPQAVVQWKLHRFLVIMVPPLVMVGISFGMASAGLFAMNSALDLTTLALPSALTVFMFISIMLGIVTFLSVLNGMWLMVTTVFGDVAALLEPDIPARTVFERVRRIGFQSPLVWLLYPMVLVFWGLAVAFAAWLLITYDVQDLVAWKFPWVAVLFYEFCLLILYLVLNYLSLYTYHDALARYYRSLPPAFRERFAEPT